MNRPRSPRKKPYLMGHNNQPLYRPMTPQIVRRPDASPSLRRQSSAQSLRGTPQSQSPHPSRRSSKLSETCSLSNGSRPASRIGVHPSPPHSAYSTPPSAPPTYTGKIHVSVRLKPSSASLTDMWLIQNNTISSRESPGEYIYDSVLHGPVTNKQVYTRVVEELVNQVLQGYNGTVFAYGMTGSGKTYSMQGTPQEPGVIQQASHAIFQYAAKFPEKISSVQCSYLEIYNEHFYDLLKPTTPTDDIKIRDDPSRGGIVVTGLRECIVSSEKELLDLIAQGDSVRRTEGTDFNARSSRSHAVLQITVKQSSFATSTLYLCDLAGSERAVSQTDRRKEGSYINKSLLTLGTVIARLSNSSSTSPNSPLSPGLAPAAPSTQTTNHIPYRDSKLTRLLQPALSGHSLISVLCTIHSTREGHSEALSTLRFAARARNITVQVKRNDDIPTSARLHSLVQSQQAEISHLKKLLQTHNGSGPSPSPHNSALALAQSEAQNKLLHERVEHLTRLLDESSLERVLRLDDVEPAQDLETQQAHQIEEFKSYISHLERQLYQMYLTQGSQIGNMDSTSISSLHQELIQDLKEDIEELRQSNEEKDKIIKALRGQHKRMEIVTLPNLPMLPSTPVSATSVRIPECASAVSSLSPLSANMTSSDTDPAELEY